MGCSASIVLPKIDIRYEEIRFLQTSMRNIDKYFHNLEKNITTQRIPEEIIHQRDGVEKSVRSVLKLAGVRDPRFEVKEDGLIKVGSFYEGHKLISADQYDFIAVLDQLREPYVLIEDLNQPDNGMNVKVYVTNTNDEFSDQWKNMIQDGYLRGRKLGTFDTNGILDLFFQQIQKIANLQPHIQTPFGSIAIGDKDNISVEGPSVKVPLIVTKTWYTVQGMKKIELSSTEEIVVNITPAIRWHNVKDFIFPHDPINESLYNKVIETGSFLVISGTNGHFKKVFTETEVGLMRNLTERHQKAFRIIKFIFRGSQRLQYVTRFKDFSFELFDTYALKMVMLSNESTCPCLTYTEYELFDCVNHVLQIILKCLFEDIRGKFTLYPHIFISKASVIIDFNESIRIHRNVLLELIKHDLKYWIGEREKYDFKASTKRFGLTPITVKILRLLQGLNEVKMMIDKVPSV